VFTLVTMAGSVGLLGVALRQLPLGTAYAVWTGIGTIGTAVAGMLMLGEPAGALRLGSIALIAAGIVGLKLVTPG
jgi:quaternary ammonium compound-resistance protein SugE